MLERRRAWSDSGGDPDKPFDRDFLLTTVMIYWVTGTIGTSFWPYHARMHGGFMLDQLIEGGSKISAPLTFLDFPKEIVHVPREVAELAFADIERWETPDYGGHFPALEVPDVLVDSLLRFSR